GIAINHVAVNGEVEFLGHATLTSKQVIACLDDLRKLPPMPAVAEKIDLGERFMLLDMARFSARHGIGFLAGTLDGLSSGKSPPQSDHFGSRLFTRSIDWDPALRNANRWIDRYVAALQIDDRKER